MKDRLEEVYEGLAVSIEVVKTTGDKLTEASLAQIGKGVFTRSKKTPCSIAASIWQFQP